MFFKAGEAYNRVSTLTAQVPDISIFGNANFAASIICSQIARATPEHSANPQTDSLVFALESDRESQEESQKVEVDGEQRSVDSTFHRPQAFAYRCIRDVKSELGLIQVGSGRVLSNDWSSTVGRPTARRRRSRAKQAGRVPLTLRLSVLAVCQVTTKPIKKHAMPEHPILRCEDPMPFLGKVEKTRRHTFDARSRKGLDPLR